MSVASDALAVGFYGRNILVTTAAGGGAASGGMSSSGRYVFFKSSSTILQRTDLQTGTVTSEDLGASSGGALLSANGRWAVYAGCPCPQEINDTHVYASDLTGDAKAAIGVSTTGTFGNEGSNPLGISDDGRYVMFISRSTNLVASDPNGGELDVFVRDRDSDGDGDFDEPSDVSTVLASLDQDDAQGSQSIFDAALSGNGRHVAFSTAEAFVDGDTNGTTDVYVRDLDLGTTERVSVGDGEQQASAIPNALDISSNGSRVLFVSGASNIVPGDDNGVGDIFVRDRSQGTTLLASAAFDGGVRISGRGTHSELH